MSPDGTAFPTGRPVQWVLATPGVARAVVLGLALGAGVVVAVDAWMAWRADAPWRALVGLAALAALGPVRGWLRDARQPLRLGLDTTRDAGFWAATGDDSEPLPVTRLHRCLDGGRWMLLQLRLQAAGQVLTCHRVVSVDAIRSPGVDPHAQEARWSALRRDIVAAESRGHRP